MAPEKAFTVHAVMLSGSSNLLNQPFVQDLQHLPLRSEWPAIILGVGRKDSIVDFLVFLLQDLQSHVAETCWNHLTAVLFSG